MELPTRECDANGSSSKRPDNNKSDNNEKPFHWSSFCKKHLDKTTIKTFRTAMRQNRSIFKNKVVLDIGCGPGILSMFAVKAGAARVFAIEQNTEICELAKQIIFENKMNAVIFVIKGKVRDIELPDGIKQVDIIVSQWMGQCLFYGGNLDEVIDARIKWLKPDGIIMPDRASLFITALFDRNFRNEELDRLDNIFGVNMSCLRQPFLQIPVHTDIIAKDIISSHCPIKEVDMYTAQKDDFNFATEFFVNIRRQHFVHGYLVYFNIEFSKMKIPVHLSTSPAYQITHFKPTIFYFGRQLAAMKDDTITGTFTLERNKEHLEIKIASTLEGLHGTQQSNAYIIYGLEF